MVILNTAFLISYITLIPQQYALSWLIEHMGLSSTQKTLLKAAGVSAAFFLGYSALYERLWVRVHHYQVPVPNLPSVFEGYRIAHLSDFHYGFFLPMRVVREAVAKANALAPDMIALTGDYVDYRPDMNPMRRIWPQLEHLMAPDGVYAVLGNHDYKTSVEESMYWMERTGLGLRHKAVCIRRGNEELWVGGAGDLWHDDLGIDQTFADVPSNVCKIILAHNPDSADFPTQKGFDLMLSGHTHGGQITIGNMQPPVLPVQNKNYVQGFYRTDNGNLFITPGIGTMHLPLRINCPAEISVLHLVRDIGQAV